MVVFMLYEYILFTLIFLFHRWHKHHRNSNLVFHQVANLLLNTFLKILLDIEVVINCACF